MNETAYRPPCVWITQALLVPLLATYAIGLPIALFLCLSSAQRQSCLSPNMIPSLMATVLAFTLFLLTFWGLQKRKRYGKWLAVSLLMGGTISAIAESHSLQLIYHSIIQWRPLPAPPYECWEKRDLITRFSNRRQFCGYSSYRELVGRIVSEVLPALILGYLAVRLLYSRAAKNFFHSSSIK